MSEGRLGRLIQIAATKLGARLFRNNCGALKDARGQWIRFGVANPGGSDFIGWVPVKISQDMVGKVLPIFTAVEIKTVSGKPTQEQTAFIEAIKKAGGIAGIVRSVSDLEKLLGV